MLPKLSKQIIVVYDLDTILDLNIENTDVFDSLYLLFDFSVGECLLNESDNLALGCNKALRFFAEREQNYFGGIQLDYGPGPSKYFKFYIYNSYHYVLDTLYWRFKMINTNIIIDTQFPKEAFIENLCDFINVRQQIPVLQVKSWEVFEKYCRLSEEKPVPSNLLEKKSQPFFKLDLWYYLLQRYNFFSVCGYMQLDEKEYPFQIYMFMQYKMLGSEIQYVYSCKKENKLYFWIVFRDEKAYKTFMKKNAYMKLQIEVKETAGFGECVLFKKTKEFVKKNMWIKYIDYGKIRSDLIFDNRIVLYYIGI